ncbi:MAG: hypothetical protein Q8L81_04355 [Bacteroidota bacterium]|nr:hypothetical protein [Bacteroidota bacterium]
MKTSKIYLALMVALIACSLTFSSCRKSEKTPAVEPDLEQSTATDNNVAEVIALDIEAIASHVAESGTLTTYMTSCAAVLSNTVAKTYTVDFGTTGCLGTDGRTRTGKLFFDYSGSNPTTATRYRNPGFKLVVTSSNYVVDGNAVTITSKTITNTTSPVAPAGTNLTWSITANISIAKASNGGTLSWSCNRIKELTTSYWPCYFSQAAAIDWTIAKVRFNGTAIGTNAKGESFTATANNLVKDFNCAPDVTKPKRHPFISGRITYVPGARSERRIDFGTGTCDFNGTVTINGQSWPFILP